MSHKRTLLVTLKTSAGAVHCFPGVVIWFTMLLESGDISLEVEVNSGISELLYYI